MFEIFQQVVIISCVLALVAFYSVLLDRVCSTIRRKFHEGSSLAKLSGSSRQAWCHAKQKLLRSLGLVEDPAEAVIQEHIIDYQVGTLKAYSLHLAIVCSLPMHLVLYQRLQHANTPMFWHPVQLFVYIFVSFVTSFIVVASRRCVTRRLISVWFHAMMAGLLLFACFGSNIDKFTLSGAISCLVRLMFSALYLHVPSVLFWNVIYIFVVPLSMWAQSLTPLSDIHIYVEMQICMSALVVLTSYTWYRIVHQLMRQGLELRCLENSNRATRGLLNMVCDLTITLNEQLVIMGQNLALAAMLMHRHSKSLEGRKLEEFFATRDDVERFKAHVLTRQTAAEQDQSSVTAFHFGLKDASGNTIQVEAFFTIFHAMRGEVRYLVGVREYVDKMSCLSSSPRYRPGDPAFEDAHHTNVWKGTPCHAMRENLVPSNRLEESHNEQSDVSSVSRSSQGSSRSKQGAKFIIPALVATSREAKDWVVINSLLQVNWELKRSACCNFHASVSQFRSYLKTCSARRCIHEFADSDSLFEQCGTCGLLNLQESVEDGGCVVHCSLSPPWHCPRCEPRDMLTDLEHQVKDTIST